MRSHHPSGLQIRTKVLHRVPANHVGRTGYKLRCLRSHLLARESLLNSRTDWACYHLTALFFCSALRLFFGHKKKTLLSKMPFGSAFRFRTTVSVRLFRSQCATIVRNWHVMCWPTEAQPAHRSGLMMRSSNEYSRSCLMTAVCMQRAANNIAWPLSPGVAA